MKQLLPILLLLSLSVSAQIPHDRWKKMGWQRVYVFDSAGRISPKYDTVHGWLIYYRIIYNEQSPLNNITNTGIILFGNKPVLDSSITEIKLPAIEIYRYHGKYIKTMTMIDGKWWPFDTQKYYSHFVRWDRIYHSPFDEFIDMGGKPDDLRLDRTNPIYQEPSFKENDKLLNEWDRDLKLDSLLRANKKKSKTKNYRLHATNK